MLPLGDPAGAASSLAVGIASDRFATLPNGRPSSVEDLLALLVLATQEAPPEEEGDTRVVGAKVQMGKLGFGTTLPLTDVERVGLYLLAAWRLAGERPRQLVDRVAVLGGDHRPVLRDLWTRCTALWGRVEESRAHTLGRCEELRQELAPLLPEGLSLHDHQLEAVLRARDTDFRFIFADDMGLGKSIEVIATALLLGEAAFPMMIACPLSMAYKWTIEVRKWMAKRNPLACQLTSAIDARQLKAQADAQRRPLVMTGSWQQLVRHQMVLQTLSLGVVVGDESHYIANWDSGRTRSFIRIRAKARSVLLATGTMMPNGRHREAYGQLKAVDTRVVEYLRAFEEPPEPGMRPRGDWKMYARRYCGPKTIFLGADDDGNKKWTTKFDGRSYEVEFGNLLNRYQIRRTKSEVFGDDGLPPKARFLVPVPVSDAQRMRFARTRDAVKAKIRKRAAELESQLQGHGVKPQIVARRVKKILMSETIALLSQLRIDVGLVKATWSVLRVGELLEEGHKVIVFGWHKAVIERAAALYREKGWSVLLGTGDLAPARRAETIQAAEDGTHDIVVLSSAYREGITLTAYDRLIMLERWWTPGHEQQAEDRPHRIGQTRPVGIEYLVVPNSYDEAMGKLQDWKERGQVQAQGSAQERSYRWLMETPDAA